MLAEFRSYSPAFGLQIEKYLTQFEYNRYEKEVDGRREGRVGLFGLLSAYLLHANVN